MDQAEGILNQDIAPVEASTPQEKMLKQSEVNELIGKAKHAAFEKGKREALEAQAQIQPQAGSMGGMSQLSEEQVRQMIADEAQKQAEFTQAQTLVSHFTQQMGAGKGKYSDFDETISNIGNLQHVAPVVQLATETGMAADVMYELGKNPSKLASLTTLSYINPNLAKLEMKKLADSIKQNETAQDQPSIDEPLSQVRPSTTASKDNGQSTVKDLRRKSWARA